MNFDYYRKNLKSNINADSIYNAIIENEEKIFKFLKTSVDLQLTKKKIVKNSILCAYLNVVTVNENNDQINRKIALTKKEVITLKSIYENVMLNRSSDYYVEPTLYRSLMDRGLVMFSAEYKNVVLSNIVEGIFRLGKENGSYSMDTEDGEVRVSWSGFNLG